MRARTVVSVALLVATGLTLAPTPAIAGGSHFQFERRYFVPGDVVVGEGVANLDGSGSGKVRHRPYFAYLLRDDFLRPPTIPASAIAVGKVHLEPTASPRLWLATLRFRLPQDLRPGPYAVQICNRPCEHTILGDLMGGWFAVVSTRLEARLRLAADRLENRTQLVESRLRGRVFALGQLVERQNAVVDELRDAAKERDRSIKAASAAALRALEDRLDARLAGMTRPEPAESAANGSSWPAAGWFLAGVMFVALLVVLRRRPRLAASDPPRTRDGAVHPDYAVAGKR